MYLSNILLLLPIAPWDEDLVLQERNGEIVEVLKDDLPDPGIFHRLFCCRMKKAKRFLPIFKNLKLGQFSIIS